MTWLLFVHSLLRWVALVLAVVLCARSFTGMRADRGITEGDKRLSLFFLISVDTQWLLGVVMYAFTSPITHFFFQNPAGGMRDPVVRFYGVEHITLMMLAFIVAHVGRVRAKKKTGAAYHRALFTSTLLFLVLVLLGTPWPGRAAGRPLLRMP